MKKQACVLTMVSAIFCGVTAHAALEERFAKMDVNSDGKLNQSEYVEGRVRREKPLLMKSMKLSAEQYQARLPNFRKTYNRDFVKKDANADGFLVGGELVPGAVRVPKKPLPERFAKMDQNKDGQLARVEYVEGRLKREKPLLMKAQGLTEAQYQAKAKALRGIYTNDFRKKDSNKDGFVTAAELMKK